jgi:Mlc titration factor MtfA (ptsG expression regulator)
VEGGGVISSTGNGCHFRLVSKPGGRFLVLIWDKTAHALALAGAFGFLAAGALAAWTHFPWLLVPAVAASAAWYYFSTMRYRVRRRLVREPFPNSWRGILESQVPFYRALPAQRRPAFEEDVAIFVGENRFCGVDGLEVTDELKVLAAASAVMLVFNRPSLEYERISEVLFYPRAFSEDFETKGAGRTLIGLNHPYGAVVLSAPDLRESFAGRSLEIHVGLHEFAHALDRRGMSWAGVPKGMSAALCRAWSQALREETARVREGTSVLRPYAATNAAEFFAVAVEAFFGIPEDLKRSSPAVYDALEKYFGAAPPQPPDERAKRRPDGR